MNNTTKLFDAAGVHQMATKAVVLATLGLEDSFLSPWRKVNFHYRGTRYAHLAQAIAHLKVVRFMDNAMASKILAIQDPRELFAMTRNVVLNATDWAAYQKRLVPAVMRELISQNPPALVDLVATGDNHIAFAVRGDLEWGTGLTAAETAATQPAEWRGRNRYGAALMYLRDGYFKELKALVKQPADFRRLDQSGQQEIIALVEAYFTLAEDLYDRSFHRPEVRLDLRGRAAGQASWIRGVPGEVIRFNPVILQENWQDFKDRTVPHEVAHVVARQRHGELIRAHGDEWRSIMRDFGCSEVRCHSYSVVNASIHRGKRVVMRCLCGVHLVSQARSSNPTLRCKVCGKNVIRVIDEEEFLGMYPGNQ